VGTPDALLGSWVVLRNDADRSPGQPKVCRLPEKTDSLADSEPRQAVEVDVATGQDDADALSGKTFPRGQECTQRYRC